VFLPSCGCWACAGYWQLQVPAPVTSERRVALDGLAELDPEFELGDECGWVAGDPWPDPDEAEVEGGLELAVPDCTVVSTASDVPLVEDVLALPDGDPDGERVDARRSVCLSCDRRARATRAVRGRGRLTVRSAACSTARNLAVAALGLAVGGGVPVARARPGWRGACMPPPRVTSTTNSAAAAARVPAMTRRRRVCSRRRGRPWGALGWGGE
jgi:hypothetical protein